MRTWCWEIAFAKTGNRRENAIAERFPKTLKCAEVHPLSCSLRLLAAWGDRRIRWCLAFFGGRSYHAGARLAPTNHLFSLDISLDSNLSFAQVLHQEPSQSWRPEAEPQL